MDSQDNRNQTAVIVCAQGAGPRLNLILDAATSLALPVIVVMARYETGTADVVSTWRSEHPDRPVRPIVTSRRRMLTAGFNEAFNLGCTHAMTIMASDHFDLDDPERLLQASVSHPRAVIIGYRSRRRSRRPFVRLCNRLLWLETGLHLRNSQIGQRVYPLKLIDTIDGKHKHYFGHTELLAWAAWAGCPIFESPLALHPSLPAGRQAYLVRLRYTLREVKLHAGLLLRELSGLPYPHYEGGAPRKPFWRGLWQWCNPLRAWRELRRGETSRSEMAAGVAAGVFIANLPAYGFQTFLALYFARRLHLNPVAVIAGTQASMPPLGPALNFAAIWLGYFMLHGHPATLADINPFQNDFISRALPFLLDWLLGSIVVGLATAVVSFFAARLLFRFVEPRSVEEEVESDDEKAAEPVLSRSAP